SGGTRPLPSGRRCRRAIKCRRMSARSRYRRDEPLRYPPANARHSRCLLLPEAESTFASRCHDIAQADLDLRRARLCLHAGGEGAGHHRPPGDDLCGRHGGGGGWFLPPVGVPPPPPPPPPPTPPAPSGGAPRRPP